MDLKEWLYEHRIGVAEFGRRVGVNRRQTMWKYVNGEREPKLKLASKIESETGGDVTVSELAKRTKRAA